MLPRFQSLAFSLVFGSDSKSTNHKLFSLVTAQVPTMTKANYGGEKKKIPPKNVSPLFSKAKIDVPL